MTNSILAANAGGNCFGPITDAGNNIDDAVSCGLSEPNSLSNTDPLLDPAGLQDNGGPTQTIALLAGGPALNAGNDAACPSTDQRGIVRPQGTNCDIGAYESRGFTSGIPSGTPQSAVINTAFGTPLGVSVTSTFGEPVDGGVITFTAPSSGPSLTFAPTATTVISAAPQRLS